MKNKATTSRLLKVRREGGSIVLAVGSILPLDWCYVKLTRVSEEDGIVTIMIEKVKA